MSILSEQQIRPAQLMAKQRVVVLTDIGRMLSRYSEFVSVNCPACGNQESIPKFEKNGINYVECPECSTFYVNPRPSPDVLEWFYQGSPNYAYWNEVIFPATETERLNRIFKPRVDRLLDICKKHNVNTNAILEVGAGFGTFCQEVKRREIFSRVVAVELTPDLAATCRNKGIDVIEKPIEKIQLNPDELFDVVSSFEVIEHLFSPREFINYMVDMLKPGGLLILTCPNGQGFDIEMLGPVSNTVDHEHLNYFNPDSLAKLLTSCGLDVLEKFTPGELDADLVRNKVLEGKYDISNQPLFSKILIEKWDELGQAFQKFLIDNGLSSNLWMVAKKNN